MFCFKKYNLISGTEKFCDLFMGVFFFKTTKCPTNIYKMCEIIFEDIRSFMHYIWVANPLINSSHELKFK